MLSSTTIGADVSALGEGSITPLHWAAHSGSPAVVQALLAAGADAMMRAESDITPLHLAANWNENPAVVQALLAAGASYHQKVCK